MRGCGAPQNDTSVKANSRLEQTKFQKYGKLVLRIIVCIVFFPLILVLYLPVEFVRESWYKSRGEHMCKRVTRAILVFLLGLLCNIPCIPGWILVAVQYIVFIILCGIFYVLTCFCFCKPCREKRNKTLTSKRNFAKEN